MPITDFDTRLQQIRRHERATPWIAGGRDEAPLLRSWQRSREAGLQEADRVEFDLIGRARLAELSDCHGDLARLAGPELDRLGHALQGSGTAVVLFNPQGTVIDRRCHEASAPAALKVATRVGVNLSERCVGTTAPAIALAEGLPYLVGRDAHFCDNVRPFFCVAAPLLDPRGTCVGALDITAYDSVPAFDVYSLVVDAAAAIENRLFQPAREHLLVRFHVRPELVDTPLGCLLELDTAGRVCGANQAAARLLATSRQALMGQAFGALFERDMRRLFPAGTARHPRLVDLLARVGVQVWAAFGQAEGDETGPAERGGQALAVLDATSEPFASALSLRELECRTIERTLADCGGNVSAAARQLEVSRNTIYRRMAGRGLPE